MTSSPTAAWVIDFAMLHEISVDSAVSCSSASKSFAGFTPYRSATTSPRWTTTIASDMPSSAGRPKIASRCCSRSLSIDIGRET